MPKRPRIPTWLLAGAALVAIAVATWLFIGSNGDDGAKHGKPSGARDVSDHADSSLNLPTDTTGTTGDSRRDPEGQDRLDADADDTTTTTTTTETSTDATDDPQLDTLRDSTIAIEPTWTLASTSTKHVRLGGLKVRCTPPTAPTTADDATVATDLGDLVERAGGTARVAEPSDTTCADDRAATRESSDAGVVLSLSATGATRVLPALAGAGTTRIDHAATLQLATEIAASIGAAVPRATPSTADRTLLLDAGLVDLPGGSASVLVVTTGDDSALAMQVARGIGVTLAAQRD
jgi:hypothetical protein